jgi:hypothetical protein
MVNFMKKEKRASRRIHTFFFIGEAKQKDASCKLIFCKKSCQKKW